MAEFQLLGAPISAQFLPQFCRKSKVHSIAHPSLTLNSALSRLRPKRKSNSKSYCHGCLQDQEEQIFKKLLRSEQKAIKLHFFVQDYLGGPGATVWEVARAAVTANSSSSFGWVKVVDDLITATPDPTSEHVGRVQGMITYSGMAETAITMNLNFHITAGEFSGSTLCVVGRNPISKSVRELPVVGGTGVFRMARGYSLSKTYSYQASPEYGILEYTFYVAYVDGRDCESLHYTFCWT